MKKKRKKHKPKKQQGNTLLGNKKTKKNFSIDQAMRSILTKKSIRIYLQEAHRSMKYGIHSPAEAQRSMKYDPQNLIPKSKISKDIA